VHGAGHVLAAAPALQERLLQWTAASRARSSTAHRTESDRRVKPVKGVASQCLFTPHFTTGEVFVFNGAISGASTHNTVNSARSVRRGLFQKNIAGLRIVTGILGREP
jgi:hypothetical protein